MLATAHHFAGSWHDGLCRPMYVNHPCTVWARSSSHHYLWLARHAVTIFAEYTRRYGRQHACEPAALWSLPPPSDAGFTEPPRAMPQHRRGDAVAAHRRYHVIDKAYFARWRHSPTPDWYASAIRSSEVASVFQ